MLLAITISTLHQAQNYWEEKHLYLVFWKIRDWELFFGYYSNIGRTFFEMT